LRVHGDHEIVVEGTGHMATLVDPDLVPGRQSLDVGGEKVLARHRDAHAEHRLHQQAVRAGGSGPVDVGELDGEVVDADWADNIRPYYVLHTALRAPAYGMRRSNFCISQAAVGQRSAHRPQCTQTSSSLTMMRPVCGSGADA